MSSNNSYVQILKSSSLMGGAAGITLLFGMIRVKFVAVLIGTTGVGLLASFTVLQNFITVLAGLGIQSSAVREIAAAKSNEDDQVIGRTILTLRRLSLLTGLAGMTAVMVLSPFLSELTFDSGDYSLDITALGVTILLFTLSGAQMALIQGTRRIGDMARITVIVAALSTVAAICYYAWLGLQGIVPALISMAVLQLAVSWHYARRVKVPQVRLTWRQSFGDASSMVRLGIALMWSGLLVSALHFITVSLITQQDSLESVGIYSAAYALSAMSVGFILSAMGADYYPRLSGLTSDNGAMNRLVNEQTEIGLLLATPVLLATLVLSPWIIRLFYTDEFLPSVGLLQWFVLGALGQIISHPLGYVLLALGRGKTFMVTETAFKAIHVLLIWLGLVTAGVVGVAMAFFLMYVLYAVSIYALIHIHTGFRWSGQSKRLISVSLLMLVGSFIASALLPVWQTTLLGTLMIAVASVLSVRGLVRRIGTSHGFVRAITAVPCVKWVFGL